MSKGFRRLLLDGLPPDFDPIELRPQLVEFVQNGPNANLSEDFLNLGCSVFPIIAMAAVEKFSAANARRGPYLIEFVI